MPPGGGLRPVPRTYDQHRSLDGSAQLLDADHVAGGIPESAVANPVGLLHWLLDDLGAAGLHSLEGAVEVPRGQEDPAVRAFGHHRMMRRSSSVTPGSTTGGARR